eukprot:3924444-Prymnesium_polylepis.1
MPADALLLLLLLRYEPSKGAWTEVAPMCTPREYVGAAVLDGRIYVAGGQDDELDLASVERYSPADNTWAPRERCPPVECVAQSNAAVPYGCWVWHVAAF